MKHVVVAVLVAVMAVPAVVGAQVGDVNPNPISACVRITNDLQYRSRDTVTNGDVSTLQDFLQAQGYLNAEPTGFFGLMTEAAVKRFQSAEGILSSGFVGPITRARIQARMCVGAVPPVVLPVIQQQQQQAVRPTCTLTTDKQSYTLGETIVFSWRSTNATYAAWQPDTSGKDSLNLPGDKLEANGSGHIVATVIGNPSATLNVYGRTNAGGSCTATVNVRQAASATISLSSLRAVPDQDFTIAGKTSQRGGELMVVVIGPDYDGSYDWNVVGNLLKGNRYTVVSNSARVSNGRWSTRFNNIETEGEYRILIYDSNGYLLTSEPLMNTYKG
jgi:peptidoglycan hydrolase-like protein with peptidoglycan-binding domain